MFVVSLIEFSKHVQNEISAKVMPKPQNFTADFADEMKLSKATVSRLAKQMIGLKIRGCHARPIPRARARECTATDRLAAGHVRTGASLRLCTSADNSEFRRKCYAEPLCN